MKIKGNKIVFTFDQVGGGLVVIGGGALKQFAIAGTDHHFFWAQAKIENDHVLVWNDRVSHPASVRYEWADTPEGANLYNREGLPAAPFTTDK